MLDLVHLRSFVSIAQLASFTLASQKLGLRLLDRDTHGVRLTADGETLLPHARQLLSLERQTASLFEAAQPRGRLRLGIHENLVSGQLPLLLQDFIADYPAVAS